MKTIHTYSIFITFLLFTAGNAYSREIPQVDGSVIINNLQIEQQENILRLTFDVTVHQQAINNRQSWSIIPELQSAGDSCHIVFPTLLINGQQKERHYNRKMRYKNIELINNPPAVKTQIIKHSDTTLTYIAQIPYQDWMENSQLQMSQLLTSPREKKQLFVIRDLRLLRPKTPEPEPAPQTTFIQPEIKPRERHIHAAAYLDFPVGKTDLRPAFRNNPTELARIAKEITRITTGPGIQIQTIRITGYASPEGSYTLNEQLAAGRAAAFRDYLAETYNLPSGKIKVSSVAEDWERLSALIRESDIPQKTAIQNIINSNAAPDSKEQQLRALTSTWNILTQEYFPLLRRVEYTIYYTVTEETQQD